MTRKLKGGSGKSVKVPGTPPSLKDLHKLTKDLKKIKKKPNLTKKETANVTKIQKQLASEKLQRELTRGIVGSINVANVLDELNKEKELQEQLRMRRAEEERRRAEEERIRLQGEMRRIADIENASKMAEMLDMFDNFDSKAEGIRRTRRKRNRKRGTRRKRSSHRNKRPRGNSSSRRKRGRRKGGRR
jgi:small-conductance mechanosensitive channel